LPTEKEFYFKQLSDIITLLDKLTASYRLLVGAAEEFNRITKKTPVGAITRASHADVEDAIERAADLGDIIDDVIELLARLVEKSLKAVEKEVPP